MFDSDEWIDSQLRQGFVPAPYNSCLSEVDDDGNRVIHTTESPFMYGCFEEDDDDYAYAMQMASLTGMGYE